MNEWSELLLSSDFGATAASPETLLLSFFLTFTIGHIAAWVYMWTHDGLSYSKTFVASLAILPVLVSMMMMTMMSTGMLVAFGMLAVFAVVRFRNVLKDTRDTIFILWVIVEGVSVGTMRFTSALMGVIFVSAVLIYLRLTSFGNRHRYDAVLSLQLTGDLAGALAGLRTVLDRYTLRSQLTSERRLSEEGLDLSYQLQLRDIARCDEFQWVLRQTAGIDHVSFYLHENESEI
jgi:hypothetical protein